MNDYRRPHRKGLILSASFEEAAFDAAIAGGCTGAYLWTSALSDAVRIAAGITERSKGSRPSHRGILASVRAPRGAGFALWTELLESAAAATVHRDNRREPGGSLRRRSSRCRRPSP